jgi:hypothetical protein
MVVPGSPEPVDRVAEAGAVIVSAPTVTEKVTVVSGSPAGAVAVVDVARSPPAGASAVAAALAVAGALATAAQPAVGVSTVPITAAAMRPKPSDLRMFPPRGRARRVPSRVPVYSSLIDLDYTEYRHTYFL